MSNRTFTAHIEERDGTYNAVPITAPTIRAAYQQALARTDASGATLQGITEN